MPAWGLPGARVEANPSAPGLVGFESWFWLAPSPAAMTVAKQEGAVRYTITATPVGADWDYGDGGTARFGDRSGFGKAYPEVSQATHTFQAHNQDGYVVRGSIRYEVTWIAESAGRLFGPFPLGAVSLDAAPLAYPVEQAQPVLVEV
jgi:hypothetical protein